MEKTRLAVITSALCLLALLGPGSAVARTITVGSEMIGPMPHLISFSGPTATIANANLAGPNPAAAPVDGRIVRWRVARQPGTDTYRLTVLHPTGLGTYTATATSDPETASNVYTKVFTTGLPIQAGDLIAHFHDHLRHLA